MSSQYPSFVSRAQARRDRELAARDQAARDARRAQAAAVPVEPVDEFEDLTWDPWHPPRVVLLAELAGCHKPYSLADVAAALHRIEARRARSKGARC